MNHRTFFTIFTLLAVCPAFSAEPSTSDQDAGGRKLSERIGPYVQLGFLPALKYAYRDDRNLQAWTTRYQRLTAEEKARYCIHQLRNETWVETDNNSDDEPYCSDPEGTPTRELIKLGGRPSATPRRAAKPRPHGNALSQVHE